MAVKATKEITITNFEFEDGTRGPMHLIFNEDDEQGFSLFLEKSGAKGVRSKGGSSFVMRLNLIKNAEECEMVYVKRYEAAIGRLEGFKDNMSSAFEHKANIAYCQQLAAFGHTEARVFLQGYKLYRLDGTETAELDGVVISRGHDGKTMLSVIESKLSGKEADLDKLEKTFNLACDPSIFGSLPNLLRVCDKFVGVLATNDIASHSLLEEAKRRGFWVLCPNGDGFDLHT